MLGQAVQAIEGVDKQPSDSGSFFRAIFHQAPVAIATIDLGTHFVDVNCFFCESVGYSRSELQGMTLLDLTRPEEAAGTRTQLERLVRGETTHVACEQSYLRKDGSDFMGRITATALRDSTGQLFNLLCVLDELEEDELAEITRNRLAAVVESSDDAIISKTLDGVITTWNRGAQRIFGYTSAEAIGRSIFLLIPPDLVDQEHEFLDRLRRGERIEHYETLRLRKDGTPVPVSLMLSPIRGADGSIVGASKIARDISPQKRAERQIKEQADTLELLNGASAAISAHLELRELMQTVTDAATRMSGAKFGAFFYNVVNADGEAYQLYTLSGAPQEAFEKFGLPRNTPVFAQTFSGAAVVRSADITADPRYGKLAPHHGMPAGHLPVRSYLAVPVVAHNGEVLGALFFGHPDPGRFTDRAERLVAGIASQASIAIQNARLYEAAQQQIATREKAEAALRETDRRKDEFLATLAHELRNPLAPIRQATMIANAVGATDAQKRWSHDVISRQVRQMSMLLDDLLDVSRITRGTLDLRTEITDLAAVVDAAVETARPAIDIKAHHVSIELPPEPLQIVVDPLRLSQVLANLLTNAAKYTDAGGQIRIRGAQIDDEIVIVVADNGIGIPADFRDRIFTMFSQVKATQERSDGGLGIGLALSKGLVELHGGTIEANSKGAGTGSEFIVRLPLRSSAVARSKDHGPLAGRPTAPRRVLLADDNRDAADTLAALLRIEGHDVTVVHDGQSALDRFDAIQPEVMLLDIGMPGLSGYDVARSVRRGTLGRAVTLIAITGWGQDSDKDRALTAGFNHHLTKPVEPEQLLRLLALDRAA